MEQNLTTFITGGASRWLAGLRATHSQTHSRDGCVTRIALIVSLLLAIATPLSAGTSPVSGYLKLPLQPGIQFLGFALQSELVLQTDFSVDANNRARVLLTRSGLNVANDQFNGLVFEIAAANPDEGWQTPVLDTIDTGKALLLNQALPVTAGNEGKLRVWRPWTLGTLFGAANEAGLTAGASVAEADLILIPDGSGGYDTYLYANGGALGTGWRKEGAGNANQQQVIVPMQGGVAIRARNAKTLLLVGELKPGKTQLTLPTGRSLIANLNPAAGDRTLGGSGLESQLTAAPGMESADLVLLWNSAGYLPYFMSSGGILGAGWRLAGAGNADQSAVPLPDGAFLIERRGPPVVITFDQGGFEP